MSQLGAAAEDGDAEQADRLSGRERVGARHKPGQGDVMKTSKTQLDLRRLEQDSGLLPKTTSKTSWKDTQKYSSISSFVGVM